MFLAAGNHIHFVAAAGVVIVFKLYIIGIAAGLGCCRSCGLLARNGCEQAERKGGNRNAGNQGENGGCGYCGDNLFIVD
ncbi:Uncharacterised protein [Neisseria dentiae]|nr:Uncharacterised protein [Neisseria dentiae]